MSSFSPWSSASPKSLPGSPTIRSTARPSCFSLGGIFVELLDETITEMAPLSKADALRMIRGLTGGLILTGARGREPGDTDALATLLVQLSRFAVANAGRFRRS